MAEPNQINCPSCARPNPVDAKLCRFCGASMVERISLRWMYLGILILVGIALIHIYLSMSHRPDYTAIHELTPDKNFARVRVLGRVTDVKVSRDRYSNSTIRLEIKAEKLVDLPAAQQTIAIKLEGEPAADYLGMETPINAGDLVDVAASLYAGDDFRHLSASGVQFIRVLERGSPVAFNVPEPANQPTFTVAQLLATPEQYRDQWVTIPQAIVVDVATQWPIVRIQDPGQTNELVVMGYEGKPVVTGMTVSVRGQFILYEKKGYWEIKPRRGDMEAIRPANPAAALPAPVASSVAARPAAPVLSVVQLLAAPETYRDRWVTVAPVEISNVATNWPIIRIHDPGQTNELVVMGYEGRPLATGMTVRVNGQFIFYEKKGYWEIKTARGREEAVAPFPVGAGQ